MMETRRRIFLFFFLLESDMCDLPAYKMTDTTSAKYLGINCSQTEWQFNRDRNEFELPEKKDVV